MINTENELSANQVQAIELLAFEGVTQKEAATRLKVHENTIYNWKQNPEFQRELDKALRQSINAASCRSVATMLNLLNAKSEMVRFNAAKDLLDRAGYKPEEKIQVNDRVQRGIERTEMVIAQLKRMHSEEQNNER